MSTHPQGSRGNVAELPPYQALLVVDMKDFSGNVGRDHAQLTEEIPEILRQTFNRCGLGELWSEVRFQGSTGDGYYLGFRSSVLLFLINPFLFAFQDELDCRNRACAASGQRRPVRMRVSINVGPMTDSGKNRISDGSGESRIETHRLLDSTPVRDLLTRSGPPTSVAAVVSPRAFEDAVLSGFADDPPDEYVAVDVQVKSHQGRAYLRVPRSSGDLLVRGFHRNELDKRTPEADNTDQRRASVGNIAGDVGTFLAKSRGPVNTGTGKQVNAPQFTGRPRRPKGDQR
jgi:hypothetical protein